MNRNVDFDDILAAVEELLNEKESDELEFKSASGGFPSSFWETYSSFANTNGGTINLALRKKMRNSFLKVFRQNKFKNTKRIFSKMFTTVRM